MSEVDFTIVIPSRNRPTQLRRAIESVLTQVHPSFEIVVVNDGTLGESLSAYSDMSIAWPGKVRFIHLEITPRGHGPSYAINRGVERANGTYIGFLDDDDYWTDNEHLSRAAASLTESTDSTDLYFSNQYAFLNDAVVPGDHWLTGLEAHVAEHYRPNAHGVFKVDISDLMNVCGGKFAHLNTMIVKRDLYTAINGMDEQIRYECEWDLYLRLLANATSVQYAPHYIARHNVPDPAQRVNESTAVPLLQKLLSRASVMDKALLLSPSKEIRKMAAQHKIYTLKRIAEALAKEKHYEQALFYAREARIRGSDIKWRLFSSYILLHSLVSSSEKPTAHHV